MTYTQLYVCPCEILTTTGEELNFKLLNETVCLD